MVPIADAVAVSFVAPFFVTILGALVLGEYVGVRRWTAIAIGFVACLIIIRPGFSAFQPAVFLVVIAALAYACRQILSRILSSSDRTITTVAYTGLTASFLLSAPLPFVWRTPDWGVEILLIVALATLAAFAEIMVIKALELTQAVVLAPIHYTLLIWGTIYGWLVFGQLPDERTCKTPVSQCAFLRSISRRVASIIARIDLGCASNLIQVFIKLTALVTAIRYANYSI